MAVDEAVTGEALSASNVAVLVATVPSATPVSKVAYTRIVPELPPSNWGALLNCTVI